MSDARLRGLERQAMTGDRGAMARLLVEEARLGTAHPALTCLQRGTHRWAAATAHVSAVGTRVAWSVCVDCWAADATKRERPLDALCPELVNVGGHVALALWPAHVPGGVGLGVRCLCGYIAVVYGNDAPLTWAEATTPPSCGSCDRARPERVEQARQAAPEIHEALRALGAAFVPSDAHTVEAPLAARSPVWLADGRLVILRNGGMAQAYSYTHALRLAGEPEPPALLDDVDDWGEP